MIETSLWFETALVGGTWRDAVRITHHDGRISNIDSDTPAQPDDECAGIGVPGLANVHSHAFQRGMAGLAETAGPADDDFWTWREVMYRFLDRLDPDDVEAIAALAFAEMLEGGFTRVGEFHYLHNAPDGRAYADPAELATRVAAAADQTGIALTLLPVLYAHGGFGGQAPSPGQRRFLSTTDGFAGLVDGARRAVAGLADSRVGVAPHSLRAVTPNELTSVVALGAGGPIHIHVAEQVREVSDCEAWSGQRPVAWLLDYADVDAHWCLIHATHVDEAEMAGIIRSGAVAGLCPITEANLGDGVFPAARFLGGGGRFGLGTDSNVLIDVGQELRALEYGQRLTRRARNVLAGDDRPSVGGTLFEAALAGGAQALGVKEAAISVGAPLDAVSLDPNHLSLIGRRGDALLDGWIFGARAGAIDGVWRAGRKVVSEGRHVDKTVIALRYSRVLRRLLAA